MSFTIRRTCLAASAASKRSFTLTPVAQFSPSISMLKSPEPEKGDSLMEKAGKMATGVKDTLLSSDTSNFPDDAKTPNLTNLFSSQGTAYENAHGAATPSNIKGSSGAENKGDGPKSVGGAAGIEEALAGKGYKGEGAQERQPGNEVKEAGGKEGGKGFSKIKNEGENPSLAGGR